MSFILLARSSPEVCSIPLPLHIRYAPVPCPLHSPHIFRGLAPQRDCSFRALRSFLTTALQSQTRNAVSLSGYLCPDSLFAAAVSSLVTQRLSAFRSYLAPAYRLCCAPRLSAESSEPSGKGFVPQPLPTVSSALTASSRSASTRSLTSRRRPDSHAQRWVAFYLYSWLCASGGVTVVPRSNLIPSAACRAVPACLLTSYETLSASLPETRKMSSPPILTHASAYCQERPASPARARQKKIYQ